MSSSAVIGSFSESFDAFSRLSTPPLTSMAIISDPFDTCMRKTYPDVLLSHFIFLPANCKCKIKSKCVCTCQLCRNWSHGNRLNAVLHIEKCYFQYATSCCTNQFLIALVFFTMSTSTMFWNSFNKQRYKEVFIGLFARRRVPFSFIEWKEVKEFYLICNPERSWRSFNIKLAACCLFVVANYNFYRRQIKGLLHEAVGPIHLTTDFWISLHRHVLLAICVQWVNWDYNLRKALIGLLECRHNYLGEHQAKFIFDCLQVYGITLNLGYYTSDNVLSNDTCVRSLQKWLFEVGINWDV